MVVTKQLSPEPSTSSNAPRIQHHGQQGNETTTLPTITVVGNLLGGRTKKEGDPLPVDRGK
jgi:hypothetical protein